VEISQLQFIIAWVSTIVTIRGCVFAAFGFLHREMRRGFDRVDEKFDRMSEDVTDLKVGIARIEGHLGIGFPAADEQRDPGERPDCAA
jgi:hypothetical protein